MEDDRAEPLIVLMHGDRKVSTKELARPGGREAHRAVQARGRDTAISGTSSAAPSPFGTRKPMRVYLERSVLELPRIYINGGRRGYLLGMEPQVLTRVLQPVLVEVALEE
jgi:prolyl-tRNA editing enzyme YbaK/EbsC (Cys-tRNA(Pro) deacylase)